MSMIVPQIYARKITGRPELVGGELGIPCNSNTFNAYAFVVATAGVLVAIATGATLACGQVLAPSNLNTVVNPPSDFFGGKFFPLALDGTRFAVNITDGSGHVGQANSAPQLSSVTLGGKYGVYKLASGYHALNEADTSNLIFQVVQIPSQYNGIKQDSTTYNGVVIVEFIGTTIQKV